MRTKVTTQPAEEPITLTEAKTHLRVTGSDDDTYITSLIKAARIRAEFFTNTRFVTTTVETVMDEFPIDIITLPESPLSAVNSVKYYDADDSLQTYSSSNYRVDTGSDLLLPRLEPVTSWPAIKEKINAVVINYDVGYGGASAVPEDIKSAIKMIVGHLYENRQDVITGTMVSTVPFASQYLLEPYKQHW